MKSSAEKVCPVCQEKFFLRECQAVCLQRHRIHCPRCGALLKKAYGLKMLALLVLLASVGSLWREHVIFWILTVLVSCWITLHNARVGYVSARRLQPDEAEEDGKTIQ